MTGTYVSVERRGAVAIVWIDNPPDQYFTVAMLPELADACEDLEHSPEVIVAVLASRHPTTFMGYLNPADLRGLIDQPDYFSAGAADPLSIVHQTLHRLSKVPPITIAALNGHAWGAGCELALACDVRYMIDTPTAGIAMLEAMLGLTPGAGGSCRLRELVGRGRAFHLLLTAKAVGPAEAHAVGLVDDVLPSDGFFDHVLDRARQLTFHTRESIRNLRRCVRRDERDAEAAYRHEQMVYAEGLRSTTAQDRVRMMFAHRGDGHSNLRVMTGAFPAFLLEPAFRRKPDLIVHGLVEHFDPERARGVEGAYALEISGCRGGAWTVRVRDGSLRVDPGTSETADVTMRAATKDWIDFITGRTSDIELFVSGRMRIYGDVLRALEFKSFFLDS